MVLEQINSPEDLKKLSKNDLNQVVVEARSTLIDKLSQNGGHHGPNLGMVEMTIALHYVFNSPVDKLIFDVSHQSYVHKMLTGRLQAFVDKEHYKDVSGYTNPNESEHDLFTIGHTSTSLSLANGVAKARDLKGEKGNVIAIIGDGSLSGGLAYEGLNNIIEQGTNTIVVVNDNGQSIAENHGGIYQNLKELRLNHGHVDNNIFEALGFEYHYLEAGNNVNALIELFEQNKDKDYPVLLHIHTIKGKGLTKAEELVEEYHYGAPFDKITGEYLIDRKAGNSYNKETANYLLNKMASDSRVVALNAGTPSLIFTKEQREIAGKQFIDVGIAEEHAATMLTGLAKNGAKPVWAVTATFMQRAYDQISHDLALNKQPGTILVFGASVRGMNDESHLGLFDIPMLANIPNLVYLAPTNKEEYLAMLDWSIEQTDYPVAIRVPVGPISSTEIEHRDYSQLNKYQVTKQGSKVALIGAGNFYHLASEIEVALANQGINATLINPIYLNEIDEELLTDLATNHEVIVTLEDGILDGGFGQKVAAYLGDKNVRVLTYGLEKEFYDRYQADELLAKQGITVEQIVTDIKKML